MTYANVIINGIVRINENFCVSVFSFDIEPIIANNEEYMKYPPVTHIRNTKKNDNNSLPDINGTAFELEDCKLNEASLDISKNEFIIR